MRKTSWYWLATLFVIALVIVTALATPPEHSRVEGGCTPWLNNGQSVFGQCGNWGIWEPQNTFPWPSSPWLPGRDGIPGSPGYNPGNPFNPSNGPLR